MEQVLWQAFAPAPINGVSSPGGETGSLPPLPPPLGPAAGSARGDTDGTGPGATARAPHGPGSHRDVSPGQAGSLRGDLASCSAVTGGAVCPEDGPGLGKGQRMLRGSEEAAASPAGAQIEGQIRTALPGSAKINLPRRARAQPKLPTGTSGILAFGSGDTPGGTRSSPRDRRGRTQNQSDAKEPNRGERTHTGAPVSARSTRSRAGRANREGEGPGAPHRQPHSSATMLGNLRISSPSEARLMMSWSE